MASESLPDRRVPPMAAVSAEMLSDERELVALVLRRDRKATARFVASREGTYLWYSANTEALQELLGFLYAECCTRNQVLLPENIVCCK